MKIDVVPLNVCGVVLRIPYMYMKDVIFIIRENEHFLVKVWKSFTIYVPKVNLRTLW